ncbi:MAG: hypothetical protein R3A52_31535 [Polyangiales bacterium]
MTEERAFLDRRDLDAREAQWRRVDESAAGDAADLRARVVGTGHPVLWRISGPARVEGWVATGPWALPVEGDPMLESLAFLRGCHPLALGVAAREVARLVEHLAPAACRDALAVFDAVLGGSVDDSAARDAHAAIVAELDAAKAAHDEAVARFGRRGPEVKPAKTTLHAALGALHAAQALTQGDAGRALEELTSAESYVSKVAPSSFQRPVEDAREALLGALGLGSRRALSA